MTKLLMNYVSDHNIILKINEKYKTKLLIDTSILIILY